MSKRTSARRNGKSTVAGVHPGDRGEEALDEPGAAGAAHAFDGEGDGGGGGRGSGVADGLGTGGVVVIGAAVVATPQQGRLDFGDAPCFQLGAVAGVGGGGALRVGVGAEVVPGIEPGAGDGLDGDAAGVAAHLHLPARDHECRRLGVEGRATMAAARWLPKFRGRKDFRAQEVSPFRVRSSAPRGTSPPTGLRSESLAPPPHEARRIRRRMNATLTVRATWSEAVAVALKINNEIIFVILALFVCMCKHRRWKVADILERPAQPGPAGDCFHGSGVEEGAIGSVH